MKSESILYVKIRPWRRDAGPRFCVALPFACRVGIVNGVINSSFHTHTRLCKHATGMPADYVNQAARDGASALGISDHCPYPDDATWRGSRMSCADVPAYLELVRAEKARAPFPLFWGFECEWHPAFESWYRDYLRGELKAEYLVYGSHWIGDGGEFFYIPEVAEDRFLRRYVDLTIAGLRTGLYDFFAHPDLFLAGYTSFTKDVRAACQDIIDVAIEMGLPLEANGLGLDKPKVMGDGGLRAPYPVREFWELAAASGALIVCNSDAHRPVDAIAGARKAESFLAGLGITPVETFDALSFTGSTAGQRLANRTA